MPNDSSDDFSPVTLYRNENTQADQLVVVFLASCRDSWNSVSHRH